MACKLPEFAGTFKIDYPPWQRGAGGFEKHRGRDRYRYLSKLRSFESDPDTDTDPEKVLLQAETTVVNAKNFDIQDGYPYTQFD